MIKQVSTSRVRAATTYSPREKLQISTEIGDFQTRAYQLVAAKINALPTQNLQYSQQQLAALQLCRTQVRQLGESLTQYLCGNLPIESLKSQFNGVRNLIE